ncbi:MAG: Por secretion system protein [Prevotella sp.]|nr:Por secretion system protein [Prevotella sp.]
MRKLFAIAALMSVLAMNAAEIGTWKAYPVYRNVTWIESAGNLLYVLASDNLYSYNTTDGSIETYSKMDMLSDGLISKIAYSKAVHCLIIVYQNGNIDLLYDGGNVMNISDYYSKNLTYDKTIYDVYIDGIYAYLSTGFGIMKVNMRDAEITETYTLGFKVNWCYTENGRIYAMSQTDGQYSALLTANLIDKKSWSRTGNYRNPTKTIDPEQLALVNTLEPGGPFYNYFNFLRIYNGKLYSVGGAFGGLVDSGRPGVVQVLEGDEWSMFEGDLTSKTGVRYYDNTCIDIDPRDPNHVFVSGRSGLYEFNDGKFLKLWNIDNSPLQYAKDVNKHYTLILSIKFDSQGNLWVFDSQAESVSLLEYTVDGKWIDHHRDELISVDRSMGGMRCSFFDSRGLLWFVNYHHGFPAFFCYDTTADKLYTYSTFINEDEAIIEPEYVRCIAEDKSGNIWIGTTAGPLMLRAEDVLADPATVRLEQVKVPRNDGTNLADYLLADIDITTIAVDGAGRKWFGTNGMGVYLISEDNFTQEQHFTMTGSKLLSNNIESMAINDQTGEVFIGTSYGLCSYMSDATVPAEEMTKESVWAYPNPVRPDYTGLITITGLTYNADVKICASNGALVAEGRSSGGMFTWDGCDRKGKRVASGVYMVQTAKADGSKGVVCKIAIVN